MWWVDFFWNSHKDHPSRLDSPDGESSTLGLTIGRHLLYKTTTPGAICWEAMGMVPPFWNMLDYVGHGLITHTYSSIQKAMNYFSRRSKKLHNQSYDAIFISSLVQCNGPLFQIGSFEANHHIEKLPQGNSAGWGSKTSQMCLSKNGGSPKMSVLVGKIMQNHNNL